MEQADNLLLRIQKYDKTFSKGQETSGSVCAEKL